MPIPSRTASPTPARIARPTPGFTLLEILIALTLMGILGAIVGPRMASRFSATRVETAAQQVMGDLERARLEAIKRNAPVTFKRTGDATYSITYVGTRSLGAATFSSAPDSVRFAPFGPLQLGGGTTFVVDVNGYTRTVAVNAAGHASIQ